MARFAAYNTSTGEIDHIRETSLENLAYASIPPGHAFLEYAEDIEVSSDQHYVVVDGSEFAINERPSFAVDPDIQIGLGSSVAIPLPSGTTVTYLDTEDQTTGEPLEIEGVMSGTYRLQLAKWPYQPQTVVVVVS